MNYFVKKKLGKHLFDKFEETPVKFFFPSVKYTIPSFFSIVWYSQLTLILHLTGSCISQLIQYWKYSWKSFLSIPSWQQSNLTWKILCCILYPVTSENTQMFLLSPVPSIPPHRRKKSDGGESETPAVFR